jgi:hypothetical protein
MTIPETAGIVRALGVMALLWGTAIAAKVSKEEADLLGKSLTPVGAEKAANSDGSIPEWTPFQGKPTLKTEYPSHAEIDAEQPLFTITKQNMAQYKDRLTEGNKLLLDRFPASYKMNVYKSHRLAAWPDFIYKSTQQNALSCTLIGTDSPDSCRQGFPFPIPKSGAEAVWNHKLKYRGDAVTRYNNQMIVQPDGSYQLTKLFEDVQFGYSIEKDPVPLTKNSGLFLYYLSRTVAPPRLAGTFILVHEKAGVGNEGRQAWLYSPALKRIRRAPTVCCDNPYEGTDGNQFYDQVDMFNGVLERYNWKLLGKREIFIPYNANNVGSPKNKFKDLTRPRHFNQDIPRYELHRVWVVEATLRSGTSHTFKKRVLYIDEDAWTIAAVDNYDNRDQLYQFQEGHIIFAANLFTSTTIPEVIYHFNSGRYFITSMANEDKPNDIEARFKPDYFTAASVQKITTK